MNLSSYRYIAGAAKDYDGADLVRASNNGVITVVMQYRLGLFGMSFLHLFIIQRAHGPPGFLAGAAVKEGGSLNAGLRTPLSRSDSPTSRLTLYSR